MFKLLNNKKLIEMGRNIPISIFPKKDMNCVYTNYIQDNLVALYDAIDNTKDGHNTDTTEWEDLIGGNNLIINGEATWNESSLYFPTTTYLESTNVFNFGEEFTIELRGAWHNNGKWPLFVGQYNWGFGFNQYYIPNDNQFVYKSGNYVYKQKLDMSALSTLTIVKTSSDMKIYKNGTLLFTTPQTYDTLSKNLFLNIATYENVGKVSQTVHSLRVYSKALTADEILQNYEIDNMNYA